MRYLIINWCESNLSAIQWAYHSMCKALPSAAQLSIVNLLLLVFFLFFVTLIYLHTRYVL